MQTFPWCQKQNLKYCGLTDTQELRTRDCAHIHGEAITVLGSVDVSVKYKGQAAQLPLMVVKGDGPSLLCNNWLNLIQLDWREIHYLQSNLQSVLDKHKPLFQGGLGTLQDHKVKIVINPKATLRFCKACPIPFAFKAKVEVELVGVLHWGRYSGDGTICRLGCSYCTSPKE